MPMGKIDPVQFINLLKLPTGDWNGATGWLMDWQKRIIRELFGTLNDDGTRQYREAFIFLPRKCGKSTLNAGIVTYGLFADGEYGAEIYSAANSRDQASLIFNIVAHMVRSNPTLSKMCKIIDSQKRIVNYRTNSFYRAISADANTAHGFNAHIVVYDELHAAPNRELYDVLKTSMGARKQPLMINITTAGYDKQSICYELYDYAKKVQKGLVEDPTFYPVIYEAEDQDDWEDEAVWYKANPALGVFRSIDEMRQMYRRAKETPALQNAFRRLYLNQWTTAESRWMDLEKWELCAGEIDIEELKGRRCWGGLDLSSVSDITAFVLVFEPDEGGMCPVIAKFWVPEEKIFERAQRDRVPYDVWAQQGWITPTPGNVVDYAWIKQDIFEMAEQFVIVDIAYDRWNSTQLVIELSDEGLTMFPMGQGFASMSAPVKHLEQMILSRRLLHRNNPALNWMFDNVQAKEDPAGNIKFDKGKSREKIDGMVALVMAVDRMMRHEGDDNQSSIYEERGIRLL